MIKISSNAMVKSIFFKAKSDRFSCLLDCFSCFRKSFRLFEKELTPISLDILGSSRRNGGCTATASIQEATCNSH